MVYLITLIQLMSSLETLTCWTPAKMGFLLIYWVLIGHVTFQITSELVTWFLYLDVAAGRLSGGRCSKQNRLGHSSAAVTSEPPLTETLDTVKMEVMTHRVIKINSFKDTHPVHRPGVTLLTQVVLHLGLQPHAVTVLPHLREQEGNLRQV